VGDPLPARPLFEGAAAALSPHSPTKVDTANEDRGPLLLTMAGKDHTVPEAVTKSTLEQYRAPTPSGRRSPRRAWAGPGLTKRGL
jgi:hypothetical protein